MDYRLIRSAVHRARFDILSDCRSFETQAKYRAFRAAPSSWASTEDRLKHVLFGAPVLRATEKQEERGEGKDRSGAIPEGVGAVLVPNDFPYFTSADVEHLVLWAPFELTGDFVTRFLDAHIPGDAEVAFFVNPPANKTVPGIEHCHVFIRRPPSAPLGSFKVSHNSLREDAESETDVSASTAESDKDSNSWRVYQEPTLRGVRSL